ncbi:HAD-IIA family hydrolase [Frankia inefficax]|uniref:HAD-superfamily hydrolase, subfamily IIA n=1 Tax=Pseudofrankia inefficax (strain DSM 45817 / CECT 9037 / DDB 130130 / EuI1c) TaxID=298654 RepID=E3JA80_PSEI1|nr:HAD-superfamily hydrolase, subfamily IIA [Pseudofrankia inefficax]
MTLDLAAPAAPGTVHPAYGPPLAASAEPAERFDVALLDLDGVVYRGDSAVPHAAEAIEAAGRRGMRSAYVTNNALRTPEAVAARLVGFGIPARADEVITSAQAAAHVLGEWLPAGAAVLVLGGEGLRAAVTAEGLRPVASADDEPSAVVQGFDPELTYARLAEGALAVRAGARWVASNADLTVPTERGIAPGNGSLVAMIRAATGAEPLVAGKPEPAMHAESVRRSRADRPIIVGDRLDTDIEAGTRSGTPTLLVLTGVTGGSELLAAGPVHRPTLLAADLRGLSYQHPAAERRADGSARCGAWTCHVDTEGTLHWRQASGEPDAGGGAGSGGGPADDGLDALRAACQAAWAAADDGRPARRLADDRPSSCADLTV